MEIECLESLTESQQVAWDSFVDQSQHPHPRQSSHFAKVDLSIGKKVLFAVGRRDGAIRAVALFSMQPSMIWPGRFAIASALSGPICDDIDDMIAFLNGVSAAQPFRKVDAIHITPYWLEPEAEDLTARLSGSGFRITDPSQFRDTGIVDLDMTEEEIWMSFSHSLRRDARKAEREGIEIRRIEDPDQVGFFERVDRFGAERNITPVTRAEQAASFRYIYSDPSTGILLGAFHGSTFLGGTLIYRSRLSAHGRRLVIDPIAASEIGKLRVAPLLIREAIYWAKRQGCKWFDFEGYEPEALADVNHPYHKVNQYKSGFRPTHVRRIAQHTLVLNRFGYRGNKYFSRIKDIAMRHFIMKIRYAR